MDQRTVVQKPVMVFASGRANRRRDNQHRLDRAREGNLVTGARGRRPPPPGRTLVGVGYP
ncbi:hypothetical protein A5694_19300 [Mycolicibacter sinensis]|nr:hypothetical protein A5694_19300 [Mycolicibacter sinensis]